ncbi:hypothetical protein C8R43DRAFT_1053526 [Mycena crocata]|nr:hypothetical protein C8R43DRAFT_1053526 [Mycena crocata]
MVTVTGGDHDVWRLPAIPTSPSSRCSAPPSLIHFPFSTQALHYGTHGRTRNRRKVRPAVASPPLLTRPHPHSGPGAHPHSHTPAHVAHRRHPLCAPASARAHLTGMPAIPHECPRPKSASSTDMNARRHQPRQPAQPRPARSLHLRPRVTTDFRSARCGARAASMDGRVGALRVFRARTGDFASPELEPERTRPRRRFDSKLQVPRRAPCCGMRGATPAATCLACRVD